ncbi:MAG: hypothetical protein ABI203_03415, partial [Mucilaginibacter sp.]
MSILASIVYVGTQVSGTEVSGAVFIELRDAATGQLTDGNNVPITYEINLNGTITTYTITLPGQSYLIYYGTLSNSDPFSHYFTQFQVTNVGTAPDPDPPVNQCDLQLNSITVDKSESYPGSLDAQVTVNATSSYLPIMYSKDGGATYQSSPTFTGLTGGAHQFHVVDSNTLGCSADGGANIPTLTSLLVSDPSVDLGNGNISRWNAAFNPVVFTYQRKDFEVTSITNDALTGKAVININVFFTSSGPGTTIIKGDLVYINAGTYKGVYPVVSMNSNSSLIVDTPFTSTATG